VEVRGGRKQVSRRDADAVRKRRPLVVIALMVVFGASGTG